MDMTQRQQYHRFELRSLWPLAQPLITLPSRTTSSPPLLKSWPILVQIIINQSSPIIYMVRAHGTHWRLITLTTYYLFALALGETEALACSVFLSFYKGIIIMGLHADHNINIYQWDTSSCFHNPLRHLNVVDCWERNVCVFGRPDGPSLYIVKVSRVDFTRCRCPSRATRIGNLLICSKILCICACTGGDTGGGYGDMSPTQNFPKKKYDRRKNRNL